MDLAKTFSLLPKNPHRTRIGRLLGMAPLAVSDPHTLKSSEDTPLSVIPNDQVPRCCVSDTLSADQIEAACSPDALEVAIQDRSYDESPRPAAAFTAAQNHLMITPCGLIVGWLARRRDA